MANNAHDDIGIELEILVTQNVPHRNHRAPVYFGVADAVVLGNVFGGFSNYLQAPLDRAHAHGVANKLCVGTRACVRLDFGDGVGDMAAGLGELWRDSDHFHGFPSDPLDAGIRNAVSSSDMDIEACSRFENTLDPGELEQREAAVCVVVHEYVEVAIGPVIAPGTRAVYVQGCHSALLDISRLRADEACYPVDRHIQGGIVRHVGIMPEPSQAEKI